MTTDGEAPGLELSAADPEVAQVIRAILPVFNNERERPERVGTCVLIRVHDHAFVVTAAHVIDDIQGSTGRFTVAIGGKLITIHRDRFVTPPQDAADVGLVPLRPPVVNAFLQSGGLFLDGDSIDENEKADGKDVLNTLAHTYFAVGFPASRSQSRIHHAQRKIHVKTYSIGLTLAPTDSYPIGLERDQHILLDYDPKEILLEGRSVNPPMVQGMSGGGIFRFRRWQPETAKLVGILIEQHKDARVLAGTRASVALSLAREIIARYPDAFS